MRAVEHAIHALAADVGLPWVREQWYQITDLIEAEIEKIRKNAPGGPAKNERLNKLAKAAKEIHYFREGWRNYAMHRQETYSQRKALPVLTHVRDFTEVLVTELELKEPT